MQQIDQNPSGSVVRATLDVLPALEGATAIAALVRDADLRVRWCNQAYASLCRMPLDMVIDTTLSDLIPAPMAEEREKIYREVLASSRATSFVQFGADKRMLCRLIPIDTEDFGYAGVLSLITEASLAHDVGTDEPDRVLGTPLLDGLSILTKLELRTLYDLACGAANHDIAERQFRSVRTIENHVESIHRKLGTTSRSALVRFATERGIHGFTPEQWERIVEGANRTRRAASAFSRPAGWRAPNGSATPH